MIVSHKYKFVFIHIPKCAGTSIRNRLQELDPEAISYWGQEWTPHVGRHVDVAHQPIEALIKHSDFIRVLREYFVFAFVRNPYERFLSSIAEFGRERSEPLNVGEIEALIPSLTPSALRGNVAYVHFCPMYHFTHVGNKRWVDEIYDFANLEAGLMRFSRAVGISPSEVLPLPSLNVSKNLRQPLLEALSEKVIAAINNIYCHDFELFGYNRIKNARIEAHSFNNIYPLPEIRAKPENLQIIAPLLRNMKKLDAECRNLRKEQQYLVGILQRIDRHAVFGRLLRFWNRYINQSFPLIPKRQFSDRKGLYSRL